MSIVDNIIGQIAQKHLRLGTLESRGRDHLDFSEQSVASIKEALVEAYKAGKEDVLPVHVLTEGVFEWNSYRTKQCGFRQCGFWANLSQKIYVSEWGKRLAELDRVKVELEFVDRQYFLEIQLGGRYLTGDEEGRPATLYMSRSNWYGGIYYPRITSVCWNEKTEIFRKQFLEKDPYVHDMINLVLKRALTADGSDNNERKFEGIGSSFNLNSILENYQSIYQGGE